MVQTESNLRSKINNGALGAQLYMFLLIAMGTRRLELAQVQELLADVTQELGESQEGAVPVPDAGRAL